MAYTLYYNTDFFRNKTADYYYFLGAALTDGCISVKDDNGNLRFTFSSKDLDWVQDLQKLSGGNIYPATYTDCHILTINHQTIARTLLNDGCIPNKSLTLRLPTTIPDECFFDFLRGCFDGDGSIGFYTTKRKAKNGNSYDVRTPSCYLASSSKPFLEEINKIVSLHGIKAMIVKTHDIGETHEIEPGRMITTTAPGYRLYMNGRQCFNMLKLLRYDMISSIAMTRKRAIAMEIINHYEGPNFKKRRNVYNHSKENYYKHSNEEFCGAVAKSRNATQVCRELGLFCNGGAATKSVARRMKELKLSFSEPMLGGYERTDKNCKLTRKEALAICNERATNGTSYDLLAAKYNVHWSTIGKIIRGKHVLTLPRPKKTT